MTGPHRRRKGIDRPRKVEVRLSAGEYDAIADAAGQVGRGVSLSRYMAEAALRAAGSQPLAATPRSAPSSVVVAEVMAAVVAVNRIGNNLNQLARERNITGERPVGAFAEEQRARVALARLADCADRASAEMTGDVA